MAPRARPPLPAAASIHPVVSRDIRTSHGSRVELQRMLPPSELDRVLTASRVRASRALSPGVLLTRPTAPRGTAPGGMRSGAPPVRSGVRATQSVQSGTGTGINPWWRYTEEPAPSGGTMMVNVGTGNLLLQENDMAVPHKGIALAFRRTYNSQSLHDVTGSDGSAPSMYGNGWTNTFDAHISGSHTGTITVWDIDGARYDYPLAADGVTRIPPPGQYATLVSDQSCGFYWTKKSGTTYYFFEPDENLSLCPLRFAQYGGYSGVLYQLIGRNRNTYITFNYSWDNGNSGPTGKISTITAQAESGLSTTLSFADVSGHRLLQQIVFPDGVTSTVYGYDASGNLTSVGEPANNAAGVRPYHAFGYLGIGGASVLQWVTSPRWTGTDGAYTEFGYSGSSASTATVNGIGRVAVMNPVVPDGTGSGALQSGYTTQPDWLVWEWYATGGTSAAYHDTNGHSTNWVLDSVGRPTQTQLCTATSGWTCTGQMLVTNETWDVANNLAIEVDPRGNETDYLYDLVGNTTAVGEPVTATSQGTFKPTHLYDYDAFNNVVAYCDPSETHAMNGDWTPATTSIWANDALCATHSNNVPHWSATFFKPSYQPYGELTSMTTPSGYTRTFSYSAAQQAGNDYGIPTAITGASFSEVDGTTITPTQIFWYDANGYVRCHSDGQGIAVLSYDALGRMTSAADADDASANGSSMCGKSSGKAGWNTQTVSTYYPDGSVQSSQTPAQRADGVATSFTYDLDRNPTTETRHHGCAGGSACTPGVTTKWYDGADRLVEVGVPHDPTDYYASPWLTRYLYDLSAGGSVAIVGASFRAYGNLFKTQEWAPAAGATSPSWLDLRGSAFDGLDRITTKYSFSPSSNTTLRSTVFSYDATSATRGRLRSMTDPLGETTTYAYDSAGHTTEVEFSGDSGVTPNKSFVYDANGRETSANGAIYGTETTRYDADGRVAEVDEPLNGSITSPARITYDYYPNGDQKDVGVASSALTASPLFSYVYRADGERTKLHINYGRRQGDFAWSYTDAGRIISQSDPYTATTIPSPQLPVTAGTTYAPTTAGYDAYGELTQLRLPQTLAYTVQRDDEGNVKSWTSSDSQSGPVTMNYGITVRGENVGPTVPAPWTTPPLPSHIANGAVVAPKSFPKGGNTDWRAVVDPVNAVILSSSYEYIAHWSDPNGDPTAGSADCGRITETQDYDVAGRLLGHTTSTTGSGDIHCDNAGPTTTPADYYNYDAENHHIGERGGSWSPGGHVYNLGGTSVHYDGTMPLFGTDAQGNLSVKIEQLGDIDSAGQLTVWDRDYSGLKQTGHNDVVYFAVNLANVMLQPGTPSTIFNGSTNAAQCAVSAQTCGMAFPFLPYNRLEGFDYSGLTFQGVRAIDSHTGGWTTPDAYAGDVHDPMSQKAFMWDRNNPYEYSDPTGFKPMPYAECGGCFGRGFQRPGPRVAQIYGRRGGWVDRLLRWIFNRRFRHIDEGDHPRRGEKGYMSNARAGEILGWGRGQDSAHDLHIKTQSLDRAQVQALKDAGLPEWKVKELYNQLGDAYREGNQNGNTTLIPRLEYLQTILENWRGRI